MCLNLELCLRYKEVDKFTVPPNTYPSIPNLAKKIGIEFEWKEEDWKDYYYIGGTNITATAAELNYCDGVTSAIQTQLDAGATVGKAIAMAMIFG